MVNSPALYNAIPTPTHLHQCFVVPVALRLEPAVGLLHTLHDCQRFLVVSFLCLQFLLQCLPAHTHLGKCTQQLLFGHNQQLLVKGMEATFCCSEHGHGAGIAQAVHQIWIFALGAALLSRGTCPSGNGTCLDSCTLYGGGVKRGGKEKYKIFAVDMDILFSNDLWQQHCKG